MFCQSCSMPIDDIEMRGTEKDGSKNHEYCKYCYTNGSLVNPNMTMKEMEVIVRSQLQKMKAPESVIEKAVNILPELKRWKNESSCAI